nr:DUF1206 domain-containing protein [Oleiagrimonas sp. C23AA]
MTAKGAVYLMLGTLALNGALNPSKPPSDSSGAMARLQHFVAGPALLVPLAVGLGAYAAWRVLQALFDPEHRDEPALRFLQRVVYFFSGAFYAVLACDALAHAFGIHPNDTHGRAQAHWTQAVMHWPMGRWMIGGVGLGIGIFAISELIRMFSGNLSERLGVAEGRWRPLVWIGGFGIIARALTFGTASGLLIHAAWTAHDNHAQGLAGALKTLRHQPYGPWLLGATALGLTAFGIFQLIQVFIRPIDPL